MSDQSSGNMKVFLGDREFQISCPAGAEAKLTAAVDLFNAEFENRNPSNTFERNAVSAGLNLANALLDTQNELAQLKQDNEQKLAALNAKLSFLDSSAE